MTPALLISTTRLSSFSMTKKKRSLRNGKLKQTELQRLKTEERKAKDTMRTAPGHSQKIEGR